MAQRDFMRELAQEIEDKKSGKKERIGGIGDYHRERVNEHPDIDEIPEQNEVQPEPASEPEPLPVQESIPEKTPVFADVPESFEEEELEKVDRPHRTLKTPVKIGLGAALALAVFLIWWLFFAAKITMPDFTGKTISDVSAWARQNKIENTAIVITNEYSFDYDADAVISQSIAPGKKVKTDTPMTFTVSLGADPDEYIDFPDIRSMTQEEIREWISDNKLQKVKITTQYSTTVPNGEVISYDLRNVDERDFTRGTNLTVVISKGEAPAGQVTVENFVGRSATEAENWAATKKLTLVKTETYSDKDPAGTVISQSTAAGQALKEGDTLYITVSKGKGVHIPNLIGYTAEQFDAWKADPKNNVTVVPKSLYNEAPAGTVISQSIPAGSLVDAGSVLEVTISLYLPRLETATDEWIGVNYFKLENYIDDLNTRGARIQAGEYGAYAERVYSNYPKDTIVAISCTNTNQGIAKDACERPLDLDARISYQVSKGPKEEIVITEAAAASLSAAQTFCSTNGLNCVYVMDNGISTSVKIVCSNGINVVTDVAVQTFVSKDDTLTVHYRADLEAIKPEETGNTQPDPQTSADPQPSESLDPSETPEG